MNSGKLLSALITNTGFLLSQLTLLADTADQKEHSIELGDRGLESGSWLNE